MSENPAKKDIYCYAPFFHSHVDSQGENRLCCVANNDLVEAKWKSDLTSSPKDFWNSAYMKSRRGMMLNNESPPECHYCRHPNTSEPNKVVYERNFAHVLHDLKYKIAPDLSVINRPYSLDYRTAICNLKCVMCGSGSSTSINSQYKLRAEVLSEKFGAEDTCYHENLLEKSARTFDALEGLIDGGDLMYAYFAGGEPTLTKDHLGLLDRILEKNSPRVHISYNTNLMQTPEFVRAWKERLQRFEVVDLFCSIDGVGEVGAYQRYGIDLQRFEENLAILKPHDQKKFRLVFDATLTSLSVLRSLELARYALSHGLKLRGRLCMVSFRASFIAMGYLALEVRQKIVTDFNAFFATLSEREQYLIQEYRDCLQLILAEPEFDKEQLRRAEEDVEYFHLLYPEKVSYAEMIRRELKELRS